MHNEFGFSKVSEPGAAATGPGVTRTKRSARQRLAKYFLIRSLPLPVLTLRLLQFPRLDTFNSLVGDRITRVKAEVLYVF
jgi:hypothetical protein